PCAIAAKYRQGPRRPAPGWRVSAPSCALGQRSRGHAPRSRSPFAGLAMNRIYRLVFNRALGLIQVAPETARARAGTAARAGRIGRRSAVGIAPLSLLALGLMMAASTVRADYCRWYGNARDGDWFNPSNWYCDESGYSVPTSDDYVYISRPDGDVTIDGDAAKSSSFLLVSGQLTIRNGGTLQTGTAGYHTIGWNIDPATLTVTGS